MKKKWTILLVLSGLAFAACVVILPRPLVAVAGGEADAGTTVMFVLGLVLLADSLGLLAVGLRLRSRDLSTPRSYDNRDATGLDSDRKPNPHDVPTALNQSQMGHHGGQ
ncbi:hypothetical protein [Arthrobacter cupressi]